MTDEARFLKKKKKKKKIWRPEFGLMGLNWLLEFGSYVFLKITYNNSLRPCLTSRRNKIYGKKNWGPKLGPSGPKSGPKLGLLSFSQVCFISFPLNCIGWKLETMSNY